MSKTYDSLCYWNAVRMLGQLMTEVEAVVGIDGLKPMIDPLAKVQEELVLMRDEIKRLGGKA